MRLTCPNCGAQYEVPDDVIPEDGRDVQCSNCGTTWFQQPAGAEDSAGADEDPQDAVWHPEVDPDAHEGPSVNPGAAPGTEPPARPPRRRELDPEVADILREEAEREARVRAKESASLEEQPDLGLQEPEDEAAKRARQAQERMRRMRGEDARQAEEAAAAAAVSDRPKSRRDMLPDIDEINQTLRANNERRDTRSAQVTPEDETETGGFGRGFIFTFLLFAIATALYVFAPRFAETVPPLADAMASYVSAVDQLRLWLDAQVTRALAMLGDA